MLDYSTAPPAPPVRPPAAPPAAPAQRSPLGGLAASATALGLGLLALLDVAGIAVPGGLYLAVPLAVVGAALVVGAFFGRARWLIAPGIVLALALGVATVVDDVADANGTVTWRPATTEQMDRSYALDAGDAVLDLSTVDFRDQSYAVDVDLNLGDLTVIVPADVDVHVNARVDVGNSQVFGSTWNGIGQPARTVDDDGADGPGGGTLNLTATVDVGNLEVRR